MSDNKMREALQQAPAALEYHTEQTRPIHSTNEAIATLRAALAQQAIDPFELVYCALKGSDSTHGLASCDDFKNWKLNLSALAQQASTDTARITRLENGLREIAEWTERYTTPNHPISTIARRLLTSPLEQAK